MTHTLRSPKQLLYDKCNSPPGRGCGGGTKVSYTTLENTHHVVKNH
jgi:hypothetical protein